jgi:hypothetical protein
VYSAQLKARKAEAAGTSAPSPANAVKKIAKKATTPANAKTTAKKAAAK